MIHEVSVGGKLLAYVIRAPLAPDRTTFVTPPDMTLQLGFVVYPAGGEVSRHEHRPIERHITGTGEVLLVREGQCEVDLYDAERSLAATVALGPGDLILLVGGGHGLRFDTDTVLLEIKQGPYIGLDEKERF